MKVVVVGGGLMGVTTAYFLAHRGCEVTVIERQAGPGLDELCQWRARSDRFRG
jgi:D-amino-acid dehydrogenase